MKFAIHLAGHLTPEWQSQYIEYRKMKTMLYQMEEARKIAIASSQTNSFLQSPIPDPSNERFFRLCETELEKINAFFLQKLTEAKRKCQFLKNELENGCSNHQPGHSRAIRSTKNRRWTSEMKMALSELYLLLVLIQNYQTLNFTGFRKILKKHDKLFATTQGAEWRERYVETSPLFKEKEVDSMITTVEDLFTKKLADGNRHEAMKRLRVPPLEEKQSPQSTFSVGLLLGMLAVIVPFCVFTSYTLDNVGGILFPWTPAFLLYRSLFIICLHVTLVGVNIYGWSVAGINHVLIFEVNPRKHLTYQQVIQIGMFLMLCLVLSIFVFIVCTNYDLRPFVQPLVLFIFILVYLFNPLPFCKFRSRIWLLKRFAKLITAPFHYVMGILLSGSFRKSEQYVATE